MTIERTDLANAEFVRINGRVLKDRDLDVLFPAIPLGSVPAEKPPLHVTLDPRRTGFANGQTAYDNGYELGFKEGVAEGRTDSGADIYDQGLRWGYARGDGERNALAVTNSELRSIIRNAENLARAQAPYFEVLLALKGGSLTDVKTLPDGSAL